MTPKEAADRMRRKAAALRNLPAEVARQTAEMSLKQAQAVSRGPYSLAQLRKMGHPYGLNFFGPRVPQDNGIINDQSGKFYEAWRTKQSGRLDDLTLSLWNASPEAAYLDPKLQGGKARMIARDTASLLRDNTRSPFLKICQRVWRKAWRVK